nr:TPA_asm: hypothetical protein HUJ06_006094 [Nelumbo nucifera]
MKSDEEVKKISADAPILFSKACELFILELTLRSWLHTEEQGRRTLQRCDIAHSITTESVLDFLLGVIPVEETKEEQAEKDESLTVSDLPSNEVSLPMIDVNKFHQNLNGKFKAGEQVPQRLMIQHPESSTRIVYESPAESRDIKNGEKQGEAIDLCYGSKDGI